MQTPAKKRIDYQKTLRDVATSMVRLQHPERLLRMVIRYTDREFKLAHSSLLILDENKNHFIFVDSKGIGRLPGRLLKINNNHPLVQWFQQKKKRRPEEEYFYRPRFQKLIRNAGPHGELREDLQRIERLMKDLRVELIVPGFYKKALLGLLLLGCKSNGRPFNPSEIFFFQVLAQDCSMAFKNAEYHRRLIERNEELSRRLHEIEGLRKKEHQAYYEVMHSLAQEVHAKDAYTYGHINQVERLGMMTAREIGLDLSGQRADILSASLVLHDVGKIGIPDSILKKEGPLTSEEREIMKTHVDKGAKILGHMSAFQEVANIVHCHHENFNGSGYPRGLKGEEIPLEARILSVVDAFHAIVSTRCYSKGRPVEFALEELEKCAGVQFDPVVVKAFAGALKREMKKRGVGFFLEDSSK